MKISHAIGSILLNRGQWSDRTMRVVPIVISCAIVAFSALWSLAQGRHDSQASSHGSGGQGLRAGDLYALVVGISKYDPKEDQAKRVQPLNRAHVDARDFAEFLKTQEKVFNKIQVTLLIDEQATRTAIEKQLKYGLRKAQKDDTIIIFLSGHGATDPTQTSDFYFVTYDADPEFLGATAVKMSGLEFAKQYEARRVLVIADACHAGGYSFLTRERAGKALSPSLELAPALEAFMREVKESSGIAAITSSRPGETSWDMEGYRNSVFTHYLLDGLRGKADRDHNGIVTFDEAYDYAYRKTKAATDGKQSPQKTAGDIVGTFPLAYVGPLFTSDQLKKHLLVASNSGNLNLVDELVREGVEVNCRDPHNNTPVILAARQGRTSVVRSLLKHGAGVDERNNAGNTALISAAARGHVDVVELLTAAGADVNVKNLERETALTRAAKEGHLEVVKVLLNRGAQAKARNALGMTALALAASQGHLEIARTLLDHGADPNASDSWGRTVLVVACRDGSLDIAKLLLERGADVNGPRPMARGPVPPEHHDLIRAAIMGDPRKVRELAVKGTEPAAATVAGDRAITFAASLGHLEVVKVLLEKGADVNARTGIETTPLMWVAHNGHLDVMKLLLTHGADVNIKAKRGFPTALMNACMNGKKEAVKLLLDKGADPNVIWTEGRTALTIAAQKGHHEIVKLLLDNGAHLSATLPDGSSALMLASQIGSLETVTLLLAGNADVNSKKSNGSTALMVGAENGHAPAVKLLIEKGGEVNAQNAEGATALLLAAKNGHDEVVRLLLAMGANPDIEDFEGMTAARIASVGGHTTVADMLAEATTR